MKPRLLRIALLLVISLFISLACESTSSEPGVTPTPVAVTMENMCEYDGKLVTVEGQLLLPGSIGCTSEEPVVCQLPFTTSIASFLRLWRYRSKAGQPGAGGQHGCAAC